MNEVARLIDQLEHAVCADAWHGDSVMAILDRVPYRQANAKPGSKVHSIREIVRHMTAWTNEVRRRLNGMPAAEPKEGDWPKATRNDAATWADEIDALVGAHNALVHDLRKIKDEELFEPTRDPRDRVAGAGVTRYVMLHGLVQHHAYHAGQIAVLKKIC